jgi:hypothetical protein
MASTPHGAAAAGATLSWADTRTYLTALDHLLVTTGDTDGLVAWRSAKAELLATMSSSAEGARRLLSELQSSLSRAEAAAGESSLPLEELRLRLEQVEARKAAVLARVQVMTSARDASAGAVQRLLTATLELKDEQKRLEAMKRTASPQLQ